MLTSQQNPLIKHIRKLRQPKARRLHGQFLIEGTHLIQEAMATQYPLDVVCCTEVWQAHHADLWQQLQATVPRWELVSPEVLQSITTTVHPDGVVAVAPHRHTAVLSPVPSLGLAVDRLQDPGNLGTLIRNAQAAEADGLWLTPNSVDPEHPKVLRASAGQWFRLPIQVCPNLMEQISTWHQAGVQVLATAAQGKVDYWSIDFTQPTVLLLGNEGSGLREDLYTAATLSVSIPIHPSVESLNVATSAALLLFEAKRQRRNMSNPSISYPERHS